MALWFQENVTFFPPLLIAFVCSTKFYEKLFIFSENNSLVFQHAAAAAAAGTVVSVGAVVVDGWVGD